MSDRYRPPSGPKGPRGAPPPSARNWNGAGSRTPQNGSSPAPRYNERDNYRPSFADRQKRGPESRDRDSDRPSGPSGYRDGPSGNKRAHPESRPGKNQGGPNKRREFNSRDGPPPRGGRNDPAPRRSEINLEKAPRGPRTKAPERKQEREKKRTGPNSIPTPAKRISKLKPDQIYSLYSLRSTDLYKRVQQVGEGTYGKVYKAKNEVTGEEVAIKKLRLETEREGFPITAMREIKLLQSFEHPNIVGLLEMMVEYNQITMIFDYLDHDLTGLLTLPDLTLTEGHRKMIFKQLMTGLDYLHQMRVIHRDIKGSNILLNSHGILKIADFGLARNMKVLRAGESPDYTNRVITIWYRPPELLMGSSDYGREVDIWGVGCLLIELYTKNAIFQGTEEISQLYKIYETMGTPTAENWPGIENMPWFEMLKPQINRSSKFEKDYRHCMTDDSFDLARSMLQLYPQGRLTAQEALKHPYFSNDPQPEALSFMKDIVGEWHEFETKKRRREERKRLSDLKNSKKLESSLPPSLGKSVQNDSPSNLARSMSATPMERSGSVLEATPKPNGLVEQVSSEARTLASEESKEKDPVCNADVAEDVETKDVVVDVHANGSNFEAQASEDAVPPEHEQKAG